MRNNNDHTVDGLVLEAAQGGIDVLERNVPDCCDTDKVACMPCSTFDSEKGLGGPILPKLRGKNPYGPGSTGNQAPCRHVTSIAEFFDGCRDPRPGFAADVGMAVQNP